MEILRILTKQAKLSTNCQHMELQYNKHGIRILPDTPDYIKRQGKKANRSRCNKKELLKKTNGKCFYCGKKLRPHETTRDHVIPISRKGTNQKENLVPSCKKCNSAKGSMLLEEFILVLQTV